MTPSNAERLLILNLLRDGKISTEDAEKLLRAVSMPEEEPKRPHSKKVWGVEDLFGKPSWDFDSSQMSKWAEQFAETMREVGKQVEQGFKEVFKTPECDPQPASATETPGDEGIELADGATVRIVHKGGPATFVPTQSGKLEVRAPRRHIHAEDGSVHVEGMGGALEVRLPSGNHHVTVEVTGGSLSASQIAFASLNARVLGGSLTLSNVEGGLELHVVGGSLHMTDARSSSVRAETMGGNVTATFGDVTEGDFAFTAAGGGITLELGAESQFHVTHESSGGGFESQWEGTRPTEREFQVGEGGAAFQLTTQGGAISLKRAVHSELS